MTSGDPPEIYPQYCFHLSPTIHRWCHFRAADVAALATHPGFEGQDLYFHINHPIKWVRIAGVIVAIDEYHSRRIYTVDDGSGVNIECMTTIAVAKPVSGDNPPGYGLGTNQQVAQQRLHTNPRIPNDLDVGQVVEVKGGVSTFRNARQIKIESVAVLRSTRQEVEFWRRTTELRETVLARPWTLRRRDVRRCRKEAEAEDLAGLKDKDERRMKRARANLAATTEAEEDGPRRRATGLEPASRVPATAASAASTSRRITGLEPVSRMPVVNTTRDGVARSSRVTGLKPVSGIQGGIITVDGAQKPKMSSDGTSHHASSKKFTGLEAATRNPTSTTGNGGLPKRITGLEPASRMTAPNDAAPRPKRITGLESRARYR